MIRLRLATLALVAVLPAASVSAQDASQAFLPPAVEGFVAATSALAGAAGPKIDLYRSEARLILLRRAVLTGILASDGKTHIRLGPVQPLSLLCGSRGEYSLRMAEKVYLDAVSAKIETTKKSDVNNVIVAFQTLFKDYTIEPPEMPSGAEKKPADFRKAAREACEAEAKSYFDLFYGRSEESLAGIVTAVVSLYEAFKSVIAPAIIEGGKIIDEQRRAKAIVAFLKNDANSEAITSAANDMIAVLKEAHARDRARTFGAFAELIAVARMKAVDPATVSECAAFFEAKSKPGADPLAREADGLPSAAFLGCYRAVWGKFADNVTSVLKAAAEYDQAADIALAKEADTYKRILGNLKKIKEDDEGPTFQQVWGVTLRLVSLAEKIRVAASDENRAKLSGAIKKLVDSF